MLIYCSSKNHRHQSLDKINGIIDNLKEALKNGGDIIVTTIQKFGVIADVMSTLKGRTFGVIIDEVHSSQTGETSKKLKKSLSLKMKVIRQPLILLISIANSFFLFPFSLCNRMEGGKPFFWSSSNEVTASIISNKKIARCHSSKGNFLVLPI